MTEEEEKAGGGAEEQLLHQGERLEEEEEVIPWLSSFAGGFWAGLEPMFLLTFLIATFGALAFMCVISTSPLKALFSLHHSEDHRAD
jgi:hypothetical protein|eukprot:COSAG02_NODE_1632_length_11568_cov_4.882640_10_plen_87_part_00